MAAAVLSAGFLAIAPDAAGAVPLTGPGSVAAGGAHACAVVDGGRVKCWGSNNAGQLGNGRSGGGLIATTPVTVVGVKGAIAVAAGGSHSCALLQTGGKVVCWGQNNSGQLGNGTRIDSNKPVAVSGVGGTGALNGVIAIVAAQNHTCALLAAAAGSVKCWGQNTSGVLGNGSDSGLASLDPESVNGLTRVVAISTSTNDTCAVLKGGSLKCWGFNQYGELGPGTYGPDSCDVGDATFGCSTSAVTVKGVKDVLGVSVRPHSTCVVAAKGRVICWGQNISPHSVVAKDFVAMKGVTGAIAVSGPGDVVLHGDEEFGCAMLITRTAKCWGSNDHGQLGNGTKKSTTAPVSVSGLKRATAISAGADFACAPVVLPKAVLCWGDNGSGQLGNGGAPSHEIAVSVVGL
jgi:alpha-tubulin suppressor-like RCC1 family protein